MPNNVSHLLHILPNFASFEIRSMGQSDKALFIKKQQKQFNLHLKSAEWKPDIKNVHKWIKATNRIGLVHIRILLK